MLPFPFFNGSQDKLDADNTWTTDDAKEYLIDGAHFNKIGSKKTEKVIWGTMETEGVYR